MKRKLILPLTFALLFSGVAYANDFHGYPCTQDCSGHKAGYEWAKKKNITEQENCGGKSNSFVEGCHAWVDDQNTSADKTKTEDGDNGNEATPGVDE